MIYGVGSLKDFLESMAYASAIVGAVASAVVYVARCRKRAIESTRKEIVRSWTNEGDVCSEETTFVQLNLENHDGDIIGQLVSPSLSRSLEVHCEVRWWSTKLDIFELRGRQLIPVTSVRVRFTGNNNRLRWRRSGTCVFEILPLSTTLWSSPQIGVWI